MEQEFYWNFRVNLTRFLAFFSGLFDWIMLKLITSLAVHRTWICTGGYGQHRMNGSIPDQNLRNDVVTPKIVLSFPITYDDGFVWYADTESWFNPLSPKGDVTRDDTQRRFLAQHRVQMLKQYCSYSKQCNNNVVMLCCAKNRRCESTRVTSPSHDHSVKQSGHENYAHSLTRWIRLILYQLLPTTSVGNENSKFDLSV